MSARSAVASCSYRQARSVSTTSPNSSRRRFNPIRLSNHFVPTTKASQTSTTDDSLPSLQLLLRGGYIRSSSSGVFVLLPNALRMLHKVTTIIDDELSRIRASRLALPTLLPSKLWKQTNRYTLMGSELYKLTDRKHSEYILAPTHEEEVTRLVAAEIDSDRQLPLRLYQITSKFRDEPRPRMGLLRTKEFLMKDLYSFDKSKPDAIATYDEVRAAYARIFDRILGKGGWKAAEADTGAIGGNKSHEYHVEDSAGEDTLISCKRCEYTANTEKAVSMPSPDRMPVGAEDVRVLLYGCADVKVQDQVLHAFVLPVTREVNATKLDKLVAKLQLASSKDKVELMFDSSHQQQSGAAAVWDWKDRPEGPLVRFTSVNVLADFECASLDPAELNDALVASINRYSSPSSSTSVLPLMDLFPTQFGHLSAEAATPPLTLVDIRNAASGDTCPSCRTLSSLQETKAIEIGHTFYLGHRYSRALEAGFIPSTAAKEQVQEVARLKNGRVPFEMGCYGIGVSRILGALAQRAAGEFDRLESKKGAGFVWPASVAPFTAVVVVADIKDKVKVRAGDELWRRIVAAAKASDRTIRELLSTISGVEIDPEVRGHGWSSEEHTELVIDDRTGTIGSKLADAEIVGYAFRLIIGKHYTFDNKVELQFVKHNKWTSVLLPLDAFGPEPSTP